FQVKTEDTDPGEAIAAAIVRGGFGLRELRRHQASLEDVFLNLTTEEPTDSMSPTATVPAAAAAIETDASRAASSPDLVGSAVTTDEEG
ncbi:MAG: hypothetical protein AAF827_01595, partial [Cyanobacteria bacterium P01_D01_bin.6]